MRSPLRLLSRKQLRVRRSLLLAAGLSMIAVVANYAVLGNTAGADGDSSGVAAPGSQQVPDLACLNDLSGIPLLAGQGGVVTSSQGKSSLECRYSPDATAGATARATVSVTWAEDGTDRTWQSKCGLNEVSVRQPLTAEGTVYSSTAFAAASYNGDRRYAESMRRLGVKLLAAAEARAYPCAGQAPLGAGAQSSPGDPVPAQPKIATPQATATARSAGSAPAQCEITGRVLDSAGAPVRGIHVQLIPGNGGAPVDSYTSDDGSYTFPAVNPRSAVVVLIPEEYAHSPGLFRVMYSELLPRISLPFNGSGPAEASCGRTFDMAALGAGYVTEQPPLGLWPDLVHMYQNFWKASRLADTLGASLDYGLPINIHAWCAAKRLLCPDTAQAEFAFYRGPTDTDRIERPYVAFGPGNSGMNATGVPDNREYHEFGHVFFADVFGNYVPRNSSDRNHGGYYNNGSSTDSWVEGFAEFYSLMVAKYIDGDLAAHRYRIGAEYDLEVDHKPWEASGWWEEFTVAGLLLDFEDGPQDYARPEATGALTVHQTKTVTTPTGVFAVGRVRNDAKDTVEQLQVTVHMYGKTGRRLFSQTTAVLPKSIRPGAEGVFYVAAPAGTEFDEVEAVPGPAARGDDDPVDVDLKDLIAALTAFKGGRAGGFVSDIADLHKALSEYFAGQDRNGDGKVDATQQQIDQVFINHGFHADANGDLKFDPDTDGGVAMTSHPARKAGQNSYPAFLPRRDAVPLPGSVVTVNTGDVTSQSIVQVEYPAPFQALSYAYTVPAGMKSQVELASPAEGADSSLTVISVADGHLPSVALRLEGDDLHKGLTENPQKPFIKEAKVTPKKGQVFSAPAGSAGQPGDPQPPALGGADSGGNAGGASGSNGGTGSGSAANGSGAGMPPAMWGVLIAIAIGGIGVIGWALLPARRKNVKPKAAKTSKPKDDMKKAA